MEQESSPNYHIDELIHWLISRIVPSKAVYGLVNKAWGIINVGGKAPSLNAVTVGNGDETAEHGGKKRRQVISMSVAPRVAGTRPP